MNTLRKDSTMTPAAKAVLDATTAALAKARAENKALKRENERLATAAGTFLRAPAQRATSAAQKSMRYFPPVVTPVLNPDRTVDKVATAIKTVHASARR